MMISFIIPAFNASKTIERCIQSVYNQSCSNFEIIAIDDGSMDDTFEILQRLAKNNNKIKVFTQKNCGPGLTRNRAINIASGEYIAFLDADDYIESNYVEKVTNYIEKNETDVVILDNFLETSTGKIIRKEKLSKYKKLSKSDLIATQMTGKMPWGGWRKVVKKSLIIENNIVYSSDAVGEEALFSFRLFHHSQKIGFLGEMVYHYVDYPVSQSKKGKDDPWGKVVDNLNCFIKENIGLEAYYKEINTFAYTALVVSLYRISNNHHFFEAIKLSKDKIREIKKKYKAQCSKKCMEMRVKVVMPFIKLNLVFPIILTAKFKKMVKTVMHK